jgi:hypothetical protein
MTVRQDYAATIHGDSSLEAGCGNIRFMVYGSQFTVGKA